MRCYAAARTATTVPGATAGPQLETTANNPLYVREIGVFNITDTAFAVAVSRYSAGGTAGAAITEQAEDPEYTPRATATGVNSTAATLAGGPYVQGSIGAAVGSAVIWTFGGMGLKVAGATDGGITIYVPTGTGQHFDFYWVWEE